MHAYVRTYVSYMYKPEWKKWTFFVVNPMLNFRRRVQSSYPCSIFEGHQFNSLQELQSSKRDTWQENVVSLSD
jgi:hypothetical protein